MLDINILLRYKLSYDATTRKLFFSYRRHRHGHIFSVKLGDESQRHPVEDIVESNC